jgi:hypothetical protein
MYGVVLSKGRCLERQLLNEKVCRGGVSVAMEIEGKRWRMKRKRRESRKIEIK